MAGITGLGTTYNLPNYTGALFLLTPTSTPFFNAIGGLSGGGSVASWEFEWQTSDLRNSGQNVALEGATAPTAQERVRANVTNVTQIQHETVSVSYTKLAANQMKSGTNNALTNPIVNEENWQITQRLNEMKRDINFSFLQGVYNKPTDNTTARKTRGLLSAITTNLTANATSTITGLSAATDTVTETATLLANGDQIIFTDVGASTTLVQGRVYYVVQKSTNAFKVSTTSGGSAVTIGTATVSYRKPWTTTLAVSHINALLAQVYDNGGLEDASAATLLVNSAQKMAISTAYANAYGKYMEQSRTIGGVSVDTVVTDFGTLNVMMDRAMPQDAIAVVSMEQCMPVFTEVPGKGHFFAEPLAKTGANDQTQLYGEVGLAYGNEKAHGLITGLDV